MLTLCCHEEPFRRSAFFPLYCVLCVRGRRHRSDALSFLARSLTSVFEVFVITGGGPEAVSMAKPQNSDEEAM